MGLLACRSVTFATPAHAAVGPREADWIRWTGVFVGMIGTGVVAPEALKLIGLQAVGRVDRFRLRTLFADMIDSGAWRLLWIPPSLPYYEPAGAYADPALRGLTKRLVFGSWIVVPKMLTCLLSYEAERQMIRMLDTSPVNTPEGGGPAALC